MKKMLAIMLTCAMLLSVIVTAAAATKDPDDGVSVTEFAIDKLSNPENGSGEPDGINTNDETGFEANRYNSYAWAMEELGGYIYVGTNRNLYGSYSALIAKGIAANSGITYEEACQKIMGIINLLSNGSIPDITEMESEDWIPQIIRIDPMTGTTKVVYRPDMTGLDPLTEMSSFRSVIKYNDKLYFGSLGVSKLQIVRIDSEGNAEEVYSASARGTSLRACALWNGTVVFGGQDAALTPSEDSEYAGVQPLIIREMNPDNDTDWSKIIADYRDFVPYADEAMAKTIGGSIWDLIEYNGKLYAILVADNGFVMFAGQEATEEQIANGEANEYGYIWTPVVGEGGKYNPGMADTPAGLNQGEGETLGLFDATATPYVYNGKLYLGTFDTSTAVIVKTFTMLMARMNDIENGPSLSSIYKDMLSLMNHPQTVYCMDENENITVVDSITDKLATGIDDYAWRMRECDGRFYISTFDPAVLWDMFTSIDSGTVISPEMPDEIADIAKSAYALRTRGNVDSAMQLMRIALEYSQLVAQYLNDGITLEQLADGIDALHEQLNAIMPEITDETLLALAQKLAALMNAADVEGIRMMLEISERSKADTQGFSLYVSDDGVNFEELIDDGCGDRYNYGGRTLVSYNDELYVGTANPFYGAQIWRVKADSQIIVPDIKIGDVNLDGEINAGDAVLVLRYAVDLAQLDDTQKIAADVNRDGSINAGDAVIILRYTVGLITEI